jgi:lipooligosaccharide transport system ATP-binding protein
MINCVSPVTSGELLVDGMHVQEKSRRIKSILGVVPQDDNLDPDLTVRQNLRAYARYFRLPGQVANERIEESLALFQLTEKQNDRIESLSGGLKRRLTVARGMLNAPKIMVLDEPTTGLDPQARHLVWQKLRFLRSQGVTMLLTTHYMDEAAHLCDRLLVMDHGKIISEGSPDALTEQHAGADVMEVHLGGRDAAPVMEALLRRKGLDIQRFDDIIYVFLRDEPFDPRAIEEHVDDGPWAGCGVMI